MEFLEQFQQTGGFTPQKYITAQEQAEQLPFEGPLAEALLASPSYRIERKDSKAAAAASAALYAAIDRLGLEYPVPEADRLQARLAAAALCAVDVELDVWTHEGYPTDGKGNQRQAWVTRANLTVSKWANDREEWDNALRKAAWELSRPVWNGGRSPLMYDIVNSIYPRGDGSLVLSTRLWGEEGEYLEEEAPVPLEPQWACALAYRKVQAALAGRCPAWAICSMDAARAWAAVYNTAFEKLKAAESGK